MTNGVRFQIPCYQRHYSWSEDDCAVLLDDIQALAKEHSADNEEVQHFMGSIVVQKDPTGTVWQIIDGQQRLITIYLFYLALAQAGKDRKAGVCGLTDSNILSSGPKFIFPNSNQELEEISNQEALAAICSGDFSLKINKNVALSEYPMVKNYIWFYKQFTTKRNSGQKIKFKFPDLTKLFDLTQKIELVELSLDNYDKPQHIFESLNSKGKPLEDWDKIRNLVLMDLSSDDLESCYQNWKQIEKYTESNCFFIYCYIAIKQAKSTQDDEWYNNFNSYIKKYKPNKIDLIKDMLNFAQIYSAINNNNYSSICFNSDFCGDIDDLQKEQINLILRYLGFKDSSNERFWWQCVPFIMQCIMKHSLGNITGKNLINILQLIESYFVRSYICNTNRDDKEWYLEAVFLSLCGEFKSPNPGEDFVRKVTCYLHNFNHCPNMVKKQWKWNDKSFNELKLSMPSNKDFKDNLKERPLYNNSNIPNSVLLYILARLEISCYKKTDLSTIGDVFNVIMDPEQQYTVEHIMPKKLNDDWEKHLGHNACDFHEIWLNRLANLTLLPRTTNSKISNKSFVYKCSKYKDSDLLLNQEITGHYTTWRTTQNLNRRADNLANRAIKTWPYSPKRL